MPNRLKRRSRRHTVRDLSIAMENIAPRAAAESWDNVGLLVGDEEWPLKRVLLTIDLRPAVLVEAVRSKCRAVVSYHPPIFKPVKRMIVSPSKQEGVAAAALAERIAVYSPHTALDAARGGTNDALADLIGLRKTQPFRTAVSEPQNYKLAVFVPESHVERVAEALFRVGAGVIGAYEKCSFRLRGFGTFLGGESTSPVVGRRGRFERVEEIRMEMILPANRMTEAMAALRRAHPYEEPAFDVYPLQETRKSEAGMGRIGVLPRAAALSDLARLLKRRTPATSVQVVGEPRTRVQTVLICAGAAGSLPFDVLSRSDLTLGRSRLVVVTGEIRHHDALRYERCDCAAIAIGHWASEKPVLAPLADRLRRALPGVHFKISNADRDPFHPA